METKAKVDSLFSLMLILSILPTSDMVIFQHCSAAFTSPKNRCTHDVLSDGRIVSKCTSSYTECIYFYILGPLTLLKEYEISTEASIDVENIDSKGRVCATISDLNITETLAFQDHCSLEEVTAYSHPISSQTECEYMKTQCRYQLPETKPGVLYRFDYQCLSKFENGTQESDKVSHILNECLLQDANKFLLYFLNINQTSITLENVLQWLLAMNVSIPFLEMKFMEKAIIINPNDLAAVYNQSLEDKFDKIIFKNNGLQYISASDFEKPFINLKELDLSHNELTLLDSELFPKLPNLEILNLYNNCLSSIPKGIGHLFHLKELYIGRNGRKTNVCSKLSDRFIITEDDIRSIANLSILSLNEIPLIKSDLNALKHLPKLKKLFLKSCGILSIPEDFLSFFRELSHLDLSNNRLTAINYLRDMNSFPSETNSREVLNESVTASLPNKDMICGDSCGKSVFVKLDLSLNEIVTWNNSIVSMEIQHLNLSFNRIVEVNAYMLSDFLFVKHLDLYGNPFDCSKCSIPQFQNWIENTTVHLESENLICVYPDVIAGKYIVDIQFDSQQCLKAGFDHRFIIIPVAFVGILCVIIGISYFFRWYLRYLMYVIRWKLQGNVLQEIVKDSEYDAFVSYSNANESWVVEQLISNLESIDFPYKLCLHERDFLPGEYIMDNIIRSIDQSRKTIFLLSSHFIDSQWCKWELQMAQHQLFQDHRQDLILVQLEDIDKKMIPKTLKHLMNTRAHLKWPQEVEGTKLFWLQLKNCLGQPKNKTAAT